MPIKSFKDLIVWQKSMELAFQVHHLTTTFPRYELYELGSQMRRAAVSIPSNIAEGHKRSTRKDYTYFVRTADGSAAELETQIMLAQRLYPKLNFHSILELLFEVQKMLGSLIKKLEN